MTNTEVSARLRMLAEKWAKMPEGESPYFPHIAMYAIPKELAQLVVRTVGGHWDKRIVDGETSFARIQFTSRETGLVVSVYRDKCCRIIIPAVPAQYECEPLLSPDEEAAILEPTA